MEQNQSLHSPRFMRENLEPVLTERLSSTAVESIHAAEKASSTTLTKIRSAAFEALKKSGLPHSHSDDFTFVRLSEFLPYFVESNLLNESLIDRGTPTLSLADVESFIYTEAKTNYLVIEEGRWNRTLSRIDSNIRVTPLNENFANLVDLNPAFLRGLENEPDGTASLAALFSAEPILIEFLKGYNSSAPFQILHVSKRENPSILDGRTVSHSAIFIECGQSVEAKILIRSEVLIQSKSTSQAKPLKTLTGDEKNLTSKMINLSTRVYLHENSSLKIFDSEKPDENLHFHKLSAQLQRNSRFSSLSAQSGSVLTRKSYAIELHGEGAEVQINAASVLMANRQTHHHVLIKHLVPNCNSKQHFKSVAADSAKSSVDGTIFVAENANGTNAHQLINNLMLSDSARTDSKPQLKIYADDVKCAHGSTTGKLDAAQQFYLESRGLSSLQAKTLLTLAFVAEIVEKCDLDLVQFKTQLEHNLLDALKLKLPTETSN